MTDRAAYSRVYWSIIDDPRFATVFDQDRALATWLRLLLGADAIWPSSAHIPTGTNPKALAILIDAGLVEVGTGRRYRIHGLDAERNRRKDAATRGPRGPYPTGPQLGPNREANGAGVTGLRRDETRRDETTARPRGVLSNFERGVAATQREQARIRGEAS